MSFRSYTGKKVKQEKNSCLEVALVTTGKDDFLKPWNKEAESRRKDTVVRTHADFATGVLGETSAAKINANYR